jgi:hypothetical protein
VAEYFSSHIARPGSSAGTNGWYIGPGVIVGTTYDVLEPEIYLSDDILDDRALYLTNPGSPHIGKHFYIQPDRNIVQHGYHGVYIDAYWPESLDAIPIKQLRYDLNGRHGSFNWLDPYPAEFTLFFRQTPAGADHDLVILPSAPTEIINPLTGDPFTIGEFFSYYWGIRLIAEPTHVPDTEIIIGVFQLSIVVEDQEPTVGEYSEVVEEEMPPEIVPALGTSGRETDLDLHSPPGVEILTGDYPGIYTITKDKLNDTVYTSLDPEETADIEIPQPMFRIALLGDDK